METRLLHPITESARRLGVGRSKFYELLTERRVAVVKIGRRALIPDEELRKLAAELTAEVRAKVAG